MICKKCEKPVPDGASFCPWCGRKLIREQARKQRGNGQGSVYRLSNGKYRAVVILNYYTDEDGTVQKTDVFTDAEQFECGSVLPKLYGGFGTSIRVYGFDLSAQFSFQLGGRYYDGTYQSLMHTDSSVGSAWHKDVLKSWSEDNRNSNIPRLDGDISVGQSAVDRFLISSNYLSINNVTVGYTFPERWMDKIGVASLRVYFAADNLAVASARKGVDPRYSIGLGSFTSGSGLNSGSYSAMRTLTGGLTLTF
jgi:hypothetical protein